MSDTQTGRCLCGSVTYAYDGPENWRGHCHCESCRRATASPVTTFMGVPTSAFRWTGAAPRTYASSPGVRRSFCGTCGTPMAFETRKLPDEIHFYAATLTDPTTFVPDAHFFHGEALAWLEIADDLPRHLRGG